MSTPASAMEEDEQSDQSGGFKEEHVKEDQYEDEEAEEDELTPGSSSFESEEVADISPAQRIRELMAIDADVTKILQTAGEAIKLLTTPPETLKEGQTPLEASQEAFASKTRDYTVVAQAVTARLRRQVYALEEANIIPKKAAKPQAAAPLAAIRQPMRPGQPSTQLRHEPATQVLNNGLGKLDVGWLNSRRDTVGKQKEAELWAQAREHLETMLGEGADEEHGAENMVVDEG